jgi:hypothetical protein
VGDRAVDTHGHLLPRYDLLHIRRRLVREEHAAAERQLAAWVDRLLLFDVASLVALDLVKGWFPALLQKRVPRLTVTLANV